MRMKINRQNIKINTKDNFELDVVFNEVENSEKAVIFAHGMTVDKDDEGIFVRAEPKLNELGLTTVRFDFRGHGKSSGSSIKDFTISGELLDLDTIVNYLKNKGYKWIGLAGASFGGGISALYAGENPNSISKLLLANPVLNYRKCFLEPTTPWTKEHFKDVFKRIDKEGSVKIGSRQFAVGRKLFEEMKNYFPCKLLQKYQKPLLIVHGDKDTKVACQDVVDCFEKLSSPNKKLKILKGSEHGFHEEPFETQVVDMIVDFFR